MGEFVSLSFPSHVKYLLDGMWSLFEEKYLADFELILSSNDSGGCSSRSLRLHRFVLAIFCPSFKHHLQGASYVLNVGQMRDEDVDVIVEFIYRGKIRVEEDRLTSLRSIADALGFSMLVELIENLIYKKETSGRGISKRKGRPVKIPVPSNGRKEMSVNCEKTVEIEERLLSESPSDDEDNETSDKDFNVNGESESSDCEVGRRKKQLRTSPRKKTALSGRKKSGKGVKKQSISEAFHPVRNQYVCQYCDKGFKSKGRFLIHIRCHENPELLHRCVHCSYTTDGKHTLHVHLASKHHVDAEGRQLERNIKCPECEFTCFAKFQLSHHVFQRHSKPYVCDKCVYRCASRAILTSHQKAVHGNNERPFMCETCGYRAKTLLVFRRHLEVHTGKKVVCDICGLALTRYSFNDHMKLHSNTERPFVCHLCAFSARKRYKLKLHLRNVHKIDIDSLTGKTTAEVPAQMENQMSNVDCGSEISKTGQSVQVTAETDSCLPQDQYSNFENNIHHML